MKRRKLILGGLKISVSLALIGYLFYQAWRSDEFDILLENGVVLWRFGLAMLCAFAAISVTFVRWHALVCALRIPLGWGDAFRFGFVGYLFNFATVGTVGGDALRAFFVARQSPGQRTEAVTTVILDRIIGLVALFLLTSTVLVGLDIERIAGGDKTHLWLLRFCRGVSIVGAGLGVAGLVAILCLGRLKHLSLGERLARLPLVGGTFEKLYLAGVVYSSRPGVVIAALAGSLPVHILNAVSVYLIATSLRIEHPDLWTHMAAVPLSNLAAVLPLPGGIGAFEVMLTFLYKAMGSLDDVGQHGVLVAFGFRTITLLIAALGMLLYLTDRAEIDELSHATESEGEAACDLA